MVVCRSYRSCSTSVTQNVSLFANAAATVIVLWPDQPCSRTGRPLSILDLLPILQHHCVGNLHISLIYQGIAPLLYCPISIETSIWRILGGTRAATQTHNQEIKKLYAQGNNEYLYKKIINKREQIISLHNYAICLADRVIFIIPNEHPSSSGKSWCY